jgi:hypothetical protein
MTLGGGFSSSTYSIVLLFFLTDYFIKPCGTGCRAIDHHPDIENRLSRSPVIYFPPLLDAQFDFYINSLVL